MFTPTIQTIRDSEVSDIKEHEKQSVQIFRDSDISEICSLETYTERRILKRRWDGLPSDGSSHFSDVYFQTNNDGDASQHDEQSNTEVHVEEDTKDTQLNQSDPDVLFDNATLNDPDDNPDDGPHDYPDDEPHDNPDDNLHDNLDEDPDDDFGAPVPDEDYETLIMLFGHMWLAALARHNLSIRAASYLWKLAFKWIEVICEKKREEGIRKNKHFEYLRQRLMEELVPPVTIRAGFRNLETDEVINLPESRIAHYKHYNDIKKFKKLYEITSVSIKEIMKVHAKASNKHQKCTAKMQVDLSCDGVSDSNSSSVSMDIFTVSFPECSTVYPLAVLRPIEKTSISFNQEFARVIQDLKDNDIRIRNVRADNPMRAAMRNCKNHASYYSCEYCRSSASYFKPSAKDLSDRKRDHKARKAKIQKEINNLVKRPGTVKQKNEDDKKISALQEKSRVFDLEYEAESTRKKVSNYLYYLFVLFNIYFLSFF